MRERVWQQAWDLIVIDEAHKCSACTKHSSSRGDEAEKTKRYQLAERLTNQADHILLLTATPHHGDDDRFAHFIRLLDPDLFPEPHRLPSRAGEIRRDILRLGPDCPWALRRLKEDLQDIHGRRLFPDRHANTVTFRINREQMRLVAQALTGPALKGGELKTVSPSAELAALTRLTANWRSVIEDATLTSREQRSRHLSEQLHAFKKK